MQKNVLYLIAVLVIAVILVSAITVYTNPQIIGSGKSVTVVDDDGTQVTIDSVPQRIVSLAPSGTEILFAVGAGDQVVGVTDWCDYPYNFAEWVADGKISSIGNYWQPAIEPIIALTPDLVIANGGGPSDEAAANLRSMGYTVIVLNPKTVDEVLTDIEIIGKATGHANEATNLISSLQSRIDAVTNKVAGITDKPKIYIEVSDNPLMAVGPGSYIDDLVTLAGGANIFADTGTAYPIVSSESVISKNPDIILSPFSGIAKRPGWSAINAVANNKIYDRGNDASYVRGGPRLVDALEELSKTLHPELFGAT